MPAVSAPQRDDIHRAVDQLSPESLSVLGEFIAFLRFKEQQKGSPWVKELYELFEPVREAAAQSGMSDSEIDGVIDRAIDEVRRERRP